MDDSLKRAGDIRGELLMVWLLGEAYVFSRAIFVYQVNAVELMVVAKSRYSEKRIATCRQKGEI